MRVSAIEGQINNLPSSTQVSNIDNRVSSLETSFPAGCNTIMQAVTAKGVTPASNSPSDIATAIGNIPTGPNVDFSLLSKSNYTESEFLNSICKREWFDYNLADIFIKKSVLLDNSKQDGATSIYWDIIGCNHDGTSYTFDLWATRAMFDSVSFGGSQRYENSNCTARTTIENAITGFSSNIQARLQDMTVTVNTTYLTSKIKLLSMKEMCLSGNYAISEGNAYDKYFTADRSTTNTYADLIRKNSSGNKVTYWTRSRNTVDSDYVWYVVSTGQVTGTSRNDTRALLPVIRISVV